MCLNFFKGICTAGEKVAEYDRQVLLKCGISEGEFIVSVKLRLYDSRRKNDDEGKITTII